MIFVLGVGDSGKWSWSIPSGVGVDEIDDPFIFVICIFCCCLCIWPCTVTWLNGRVFWSRYWVSPVHEMKLILFVACIHVCLTGDKHAACWYLARSRCVCFLQMVTANLWLVDCSLATWYILSNEFLSWCCWLLMNCSHFLTVMLETEFVYDNVCDVGVL